MTAKTKAIASLLMASMVTVSVTLFLWPKPISWMVIGGAFIGIMVVIFAVPNAKR